MSINTSNFMEVPPSGLRRDLHDLLSKPVAAGTAIIPNYWAWVHKSAQQLAKPLPILGFKQALIRGAKEGAPAVAVIVGSQTLIQDRVEDALKRVMTPGTSKFTATSSFIVGASTSWALAGYNGMSAGIPFWTAVKRLKAPQVGVVAARETAFLFSLRGSAPIEHKLNKLVGENKVNSYAAALFSGGLGSIVVHPADTAFTLWQNNKTILSTAKHTSFESRAIDCGKTLMRGCARKSVGTAGFAVCYKIAKQIFGVE